ncbi:hypothetical protein DY000_02058417 [Brassica cretica]|uniref:Kinesin-like protein n=1 Tax=Brassica cretica TaxID=69181 RepID=A0ABQ7A9V9_BRACR|nr:hypothetical protein DY000_02058417 [Brassica cretica]
MSVTLHTNLGDIKCEIFCDEVPKGAENFLALCASGYYDGTIFHRNIKGFMIQGGDPTGTGKGGTSIWAKKFNDEIRDSLKHNARGMLSMANSGPNTNGSQFFITYAKQPHLNGLYTIFGKVIHGIYLSLLTFTLMQLPGRVRVAVRLRPRNADECVADADFADCVELQPELKRLKLRKNNWDTETYEFDEVLTESASQKRVYQVVAKPVVESVLEGYNGTVMAYGQTGTGKTFTLGRLGDEDTAARGIMVRSMEDIISGTSLDTDSISVSYLQLYMETIQDLLDPSNDNIAIVEDPKTGDVSLPGATHVEIRNQQNFLELLHLGETHRVAANTKLNTESSRSHAILMVHVKRSVVEHEDSVSNDTDNSSHFVRPSKPLVRRSKLVLVDLAGSERVHKSGSEGHMLEEAKSINLSLSALGKCINAIAENSPHVPLRDSKLTRLLRDSFGGTARTSLIVTIGPSPRHRGETTSTILFGQRVRFSLTLPFP